MVLCDFSHRINSEACSKKIVQPASLWIKGRKTRTNVRGSKWIGPGAVPRGTIYLGIMEASLEEVWDDWQKQTWHHKDNRVIACVSSSVFFRVMEQLRHLELWLSSWSILLDPVHIFSNVTEKINGLKESVNELWRTDDWQIRLSWLLLICTAFNIVFIGIAWHIYRETISNMLFNKSRSPVHQRSKTNVLSSSVEDLIVKKIQ